jgi:HPt (histidine-containing phosphotransfer) domain-containing protein
MEMDKVALKQYGINYDAGVARFMGDAPMYEELLREFPADMPLSGLRQAFEENDYEALFQISHAMKGVTGNLDMDRLFPATSALTEYLRGTKTPDPGQVAALYEKVCTEYDRVCEGIRKCFPAPQENS